MEVLVSAPPCVLYEDEHILVADKPAGLNTHSPSPYAGEGLYDWLRCREPRWATLAIIHRLDKATSGVMVFAKTRLANQSLTNQFAERQVRKRYLFLAAASGTRDSISVKTGWRRAGEKYITTPVASAEETAETRFQFVQELKGRALWAAEPLTGRTHQIRVHAQYKGLPILGDLLYGGAEFPRVCLHAERLSFKHPGTGEDVEFRSEPDFDGDPAIRMRAAIIEPETTNCFRLLHGSADGHPGIYAERWGDYMLASSESPLDARSSEFLRIFSEPLAGLYHKKLERRIRQTAPTDVKPVLLQGKPAPEYFRVMENGIQFEISFEQGYSVGLFLDQRENRRRLITNYIAPDFELIPGGLKGRDVLNTFAYTCGFSVCAAKAGAVTTSLDLSKKYLDWGKRNFAANDLDPAAHDFIYGDVFDWAARLVKKGRRFDLVLLDPPTFSNVKRGGIFQAEKDYGKLVETILPLVKSEGILFASTNARNLAPEAFLAQIREALARAGRRELQLHYVPQPIDFPISREEAAYLKCVWIRVS